MSHSDPPTRHQQAVPQGRGMGESPDNYHSSPPRGTPAPCPPSPAPASLGSCQDRSRTEWSRPGWLGTAGREQEGFIDGTSSSLGCPQGAAPTRNSVTALPPVSGGDTHSQGDSGCCTHRCLPHGPRAPRVPALSAKNPLWPWPGAAWTRGSSLASPRSSGANGSCSQTCSRTHHGCSYFPDRDK